MFSGCSSLTSITIPNGVTSIGKSAFSKCSSLTSITIPNRVTSIGGSAFSNCRSLTSITIPSRVTSIGDWAFLCCGSVTSITIPNRVTSIGDGVFDGCSSLTSITIPKNVTSIGESAFSKCSSLTSITIPNRVTSIGESAFNDCSSLTSITIPNSVTSIGYSAFSGCDKLKDVYYVGNKEQWNSIDINHSNYYLTDAAIHYNSIIPTGTYEVEILNYNGIDNKYVINSVARNNTDEKLTSCLLYSAVYSPDGTLKGCNTVKTDIAANDDTDVDITVSCDIEAGDTIKTFMWNNDMSALAEIADLVVE